jgi:hypothetical protein
LASEAKVIEMPQKEVSGTLMQRGV